MSPMPAASSSSPWRPTPRPRQSFAAMPEPAATCLTSCAAPLPMGSTRVPAAGPCRRPCRRRPRATTGRRRPWPNSPKLTAVPLPAFSRRSRRWRPTLRGVSSRPAPPTANRCPRRIHGSPRMGWRTATARTLPRPSTGRHGAMMRPWRDWRVRGTVRRAGCGPAAPSTRSPGRPGGSRRRRATCPGWRCRRRTWRGGPLPLPVRWKACWPGWRDPRCRRFSPRRRRAMHRHRPVTLPTRSSRTCWISSASMSPWWRPATTRWSIWRPSATNSSPPRFRPSAC